MIIPGDAYSIGTGGYFLSAPFPLLNNLVAIPASPERSESFVITCDFDETITEAYCTINGIMKVMAVSLAQGVVSFPQNTFAPGTYPITILGIHRINGYGYSSLDTSYSINILAPSTFSLYNDILVQLKRLLDTNYGVDMIVEVAGTTKLKRDQPKPYMYLVPLRVNNNFDPIGREVSQGHGEAEGWPLLISVIVRRDTILYDTSESELLRVIMQEVYELLRMVEEDLDLYLPGANYLRNINIGGISNLYYDEDSDEFRQDIDFTVMFNHVRG